MLKFYDKLTYFQYPKELTYCPANTDDTYSYCSHCQGLPSLQPRKKTILNCLPAVCSLSLLG